MNIQQHARITRIKQLSHYLYLCLTGIYYLLWVVIPLVVVFTLVGREGTVTFAAGGSFDTEELSFPIRFLLAIFISFTTLLLLKVIHHFRELIRLFAKGEIFNQTAIQHARKGLIVGLVLYGISLLTMLGNWVYNLMQQSPELSTFNGDFITAFLFFGLMFVLLWALEIGADLNDESELTI